MIQRQQKILCVAGFPGEVDGYHGGMHMLLTGHPGKEARSLVYPAELENCICQRHVDLPNPTLTLASFEVPKLVEMQPHRLLCEDPEEHSRVIQGESLCLLSSTPSFHAVLVIQPIYPQPCEDGREGQARLGRRPQGMSHPPPYFYSCPLC